MEAMKRLRGCGGVHNTWVHPFAWEEAGGWARARGGSLRAAMGLGAAKGVREDEDSGQGRLEIKDGKLSRLASLVLHSMDLAKRKCFDGGMGIAGLNCCAM